MGRPLVERIDLTPCYTVDDGGSCWVVRCRRCSAGWLPSKEGAEGMAALVEHAKQHRVRLPRRPLLPRPVVRTIVVTVGGKVVKRLRGCLTLPQAVAECEGTLSIDVRYQLGSVEVNPTNWKLMR